MLRWTVSPWFLWTMTVLCFAAYNLAAVLLIVAAVVCMFWWKERIGARLKSAAFLLYLCAATIPLAWFGVAVAWFVISYKVSEWRHEANLNPIHQEMQNDA